MNEREFARNYILAGKESGSVFAGLSDRQHRPTEEESRIVPSGPPRVVVSHPLSIQQSLSLGANIQLVQCRECAKSPTGPN